VRDDERVETFDVGVGNGERHVCPRSYMSHLAFDARLM
jgi:hypothetical protein